MGEQRMGPEQAGSQPERPSSVGAEPTATPAPGFALGVGAVTALVALMALSPLLVNLEGPFGEHALLGRVTSVLVALLAGAAVGFLTHVVAGRSIRGLVALVAGSAALAFVLFPTPVDRNESFVERANQRSSCLGLTFRHYPPGTMDADSTVYCVGLERPLSAG